VWESLWNLRKPRWIQLSLTGDEEKGPEMVRGAVGPVERKPRV